MRIDVLKNWYGEEDFTMPYRLVAPSYSLVPLKFVSKEESLKLLNACRDLGFQAILSVVNPKTNRSKILGFSCGLRSKNR